MQAHCSQPKKISSLTLKASGPEVTVCYPVKRNKCMSDLEKCWELNCIKALSLPELQTNWIKLEKQLPMCAKSIFSIFSISLFYRRLAGRVLFNPIFCPCQNSPNEIPKNQEVKGARMLERTEQTLSDRHTSHTSTPAAVSFPFPSLLKFHIEIPSRHSASLALSLSRQPATKSASFCGYAHTLAAQNPNFS